MSARKVLISPAFGAGWSTWIGSNREQKSTPLGDFVKRFTAAFPAEADDIYTGGARSLEVQVIEGQFTVEEYDGSESIRLRADDDLWF